MTIKGRKYSRPLVAKGRIWSGRVGTSPCSVKSRKGVAAAVGRAQCGAEATSAFVPQLFSSSCSAVGMAALPH